MTGIRDGSVCSGCFLQACRQADSPSGRQLLLDVVPADEQDHLSPPLLKFLGNGYAGVEVPACAATGDRQYDGSAAHGLPCVF